MARIKPDKASATTANFGFEAKLCLNAGKLCNNFNAAESTHGFVWLIFLKYLSNAFEEHFAMLASGKSWTNPENPDENEGEPLFRVSKEARWSHLQAEVAVEREHLRPKGAPPTKKTGSSHETQGADGGMEFLSSFAIRQATACFLKSRTLATMVPKPLSDELSHKLEILTT